MNTPEDPLIHFSINRIRLKSYLGIGLKKVRKLGEEILKTILKILTLILRGFLFGYKKLSGFARSNQKGIWILILLSLLLVATILVKRLDTKQEKYYLEIRWLYEKQVEEDEKQQTEWEEKEKEFEERLKELDEKVTSYNSEKNQSLAMTQPETGVANVEQWRDLVTKYFPEKEVNFALAIMECESGGDPTKMNWEDAKITGYPSCGLFQINGPMNWDCKNPEENVPVAYEKWSRRGWQPWLNCQAKLAS